MATPNVTEMNFFNQAGEPNLYISKKVRTNEMNFFLPSKEVFHFIAIPVQNTSNPIVSRRRIFIIS